MKRAVLRMIAWLAAAGWLYLALLLLDVFWNIATWQPRWDGPAFGLLGSVLVGLLAIWKLTRSDSGRVERVVTFVICLGFFGLGIYVFPAEPLSQGLFARETSSPLWYRTLRLIVLSVPLLLWVTRKWPDRFTFRNGARTRPS
jgi:hypothetical protein